MDFHSEYGVDLDSGILDERGWSWYVDRLLGLLEAETRIRYKLYPPETPKTPKSPRG